MNWISRRSFLGSGASVAVLPRISPGPVHHFLTPNYEIRMTLECYDHYSSRGFRFEERLSHRDFCFSSHGESNRQCLDGFRGAIAVARYRIRPRGPSGTTPALCERVHSIDGSAHFPFQPPFERTIALQQGIASDVQVFGYQTNASVQGEVRPDDKDDLWCLLRQDLSFAGQSAPFLVLHWKHTLQAIRVLDLIPGAGTSLVVGLP